MEFSKTALKTFNILETKKFMSKKRKFEDLLTLVDSEAYSSPPKKANESLDDSLKELKQELKRLTQKPEPVPSFYLKPTGVKAKLNFFYLESPLPTESVSPLFSNDISNLVLKSVLGPLFPYTLGWAKINNPQMIVKSVLFIVEGLTKIDVIQKKDDLINIPGIFYDVLDVVTENIPFSVTLCKDSNSEYFNATLKNTFTCKLPSENKHVVEDTASSSLSRLHLLLSPIQLAMNNYPLPQSVLCFSRSNGYIFTKDQYSPVNDNSALFAIDCEMCRTNIGMNELTHIAVIDENLTTVYETLVKPKAKIVDYVTKFSGITPEMLKGVTTTLNDVQKKIREILPSDAILIGQSLNCDLHAMKMIHPYVIDTSLIYNVSGVRDKKENLRNLAHLHLKEVIQDKTSGHNPVEDAVTAMKLVKLKLKNNVSFGDACLKSLENENKEEDVSSNSTNFAEKSDSKPGSCMTYIEGNFFNKINACGKTVALIGTEDTLNAYPTQILSNTVCKYPKSSSKKIIKAAIKYKDDFDLTIIHLRLNVEDINFLNDSLKNLYDSLPLKTMFMTHVSGIDLTDHKNIKSGLFFAALKT